MKGLFKVLTLGAVLFAQVVGAVFLFSIAFGLISQADTLTATGGFLLALVTGVVGAWVCVATTFKLLRSIKEMRTVPPATAALIVLCMFLLNACTTISPGHVGIKVSKYGSERGVSDYTLQTGAVWFMPGVSSVFEYPTFVQTVKWTASKDEGSPLNEEFTFNSKDAAVITADISLSYQLEAAKVPHFYVKFRSDDMESFTNGYLHNVARDAFQESAVNYTALELYGDKKDAFLKAVRTRISEGVDSLGISITQFGLLGNLRLPPAITDAVNAKIAATQNAQRAQNEVIQAQAEAQKSVATAQGQAQANALLTRSLSPELIQWRQLDIQQQAIGRWDGKLPVYTAGGGIPLIQLPVKP